MGWVMRVAGKQPYSFVALREKDFYKKLVSPHCKVPLFCNREGFSGMTNWVCWLYLNCEMLCPWNDGHIHEGMLPWDLGSHGFPGTAAQAQGVCFTVVTKHCQTNRPCPASSTLGCL